MLTLIAESKTMSCRERAVSPDRLSCHTPVFETEASEIIEYLSSATTDELAMRISISHALAAKAARMIYEFPNKSTGSEAISAFTGEVFRGIDISTVSETAKTFAASHMMIISSLYGLLRTDDIVKPYRLDFNAPCAPDGEKLSKFWKAKLSAALLSHLKDTGEKEVLDLLPAEAAKCIDWKIIKTFAKVMKVDFKTIDNNGNLKTPHSGKLKEMRGKMVRAVISEKIDNFKDLTDCHTPSFAPDHDLHNSDMAAFIVL